MRKAKQERKRRRRKWLRIILEITFMACGILGTRLPEPYDIYALLTLGALRIILSAVQRERKAEEPPAIVYCNGEKAPYEEEPANAMKTTHIRGATDKTTENYYITDCKRIFYGSGLSVQIPESIRRLA